MYLASNVLMYLVLLGAIYYSYNSAQLVDDFVQVNEKKEHEHRRMSEFHSFSFP